MNIFSKIILFAPIAILFGCSSSEFPQGSEFAGSTTETENAIATNSKLVSIQVFSNDLEVNKIAYRILPSWYVTDTSGIIDESDYTFKGTTDTLGRILIENHPEGSFTIQIGNEDSSIALRYTLNKLSEEFIVKKAELTKNGFVKGWISLPEENSPTWVHIPGIGKVSKTDNKGNFIFSHIPTGNLTIKAWNNKSMECIAQKEFSVQAGDTIDVGHVDAPDEFITKKSMRINPRNLISNWMRPINTPYVLVLRLDSTNFDFSEALEDGSDIHLLDISGKEIPFEIDDFDVKLQSATINIRLDSIQDTASIWNLEWGEIYNPKQKQVNAWKNISSSLQYHLNSVEIFHFDSSSKYNDLPSPLKKQPWYIQLHEKDTLTDTLIVTTLNATDYLESSSERGGKVVHYKYKQTYPNFVVIGTRLTNTPHNWSRMDSLVVWIKGNGEYEIILENLTYDKNYKASYKAKAQDKWERIVIRPEDFNRVLKEYHGWEITKDKITNFTVFAYNGSEIYLDNVRIYGINRDDF